MHHPLQQRFLAEDLVRRRRAVEHQRYAAAQRQGTVDPNPHQIDAVVFALQRIPEGGCILADEVGLGKTIEAGLVIAQLLAEGKRRVLILVPKPLLGQWQSELYDHFGITVRDGRPGDDADLDGDGVFILGREWAGGERGAAAIEAAPPFDLCVIDEAHEIFAGIHRRYDQRGREKRDPGVAVLAQRVKRALEACPKLLLTATPIQNSLAELWGLVQYIEPTGTLLGDLGNFRALFSPGGDGDGPALLAGQSEELRRRLQTVVRRTLRRQAEEFLEQPFVQRQARLFEYSMSEPERALYDDVTRYLLTPNLCAFRGASRGLLLLGFHRRMASSLAALAKSLENVAARLRALLDDPDAAVENILLELARDLEEDDDGDPPPRDHRLPAAGKQRVAEELALVESFAQRARAIDRDSKADAVVRAVRWLLERAQAGEGSGKVVVFTESLTTQDYLAELLAREVPLDGQAITLFRGDNRGRRADQALARWQDEVGSQLPEHRRPGPSVAVRQALVHEFRTRSQVFISTEAGAKGLNLQFCETLINVDLPWNPQRIEQRIGRCHRYGQQRDVTVINFVARDNAAQRLTFELLARKLDLFGRVLDASDVVLHEPSDTAPETLASAFAGEVEAGLRRAYDRARDIDEIERELAQLQERIGGEVDDLKAALRRTRGVVESRQDAAARRTFAQIQEDLPRALVRFDEDLLRLVTGYLDGLAVRYAMTRELDRVLLCIDAHDALPAPLRDGLTAVVGPAGPPGGEVLHLAHPLVRAALDRSLASAQGARLRLRLELDGAPERLRAAEGHRGRMAVTRLRFEGVEEVERLVVTALLEGDDQPLGPDEARALLRLPAHDCAPAQRPVAVHDADLAEAVEEDLFVQRVHFAHEERDRFAQRLHQLQRSLDDQALVLRQQERAARQQLERARDERDGAVSADGRRRAAATVATAEERLEEIEAELERLAQGRDDRYQSTREATLGRRYGPIVAQRILAAEFVLG